MIDVGLVSAALSFVAEVSAEVGKAIVAGTLERAGLDKIVEEARSRWLACEDQPQRLRADDAQVDAALAAPRVASVGALGNAVTRVDSDALRAARASSLTSIETGALPTGLIVPK